MIVDVFLTKTISLSANGWGFRRITQGYDRDAYYHEYFLRDLTHLAKKMKRPKVAEKMSMDPDHEPDFYAIDREFPLPCGTKENGQLKSF